MQLLNQLEVMDSPVVKKEQMQHLRPDLRLPGQFCFRTLILIKSAPHCLLSARVVENCGPSIHTTHLTVNSIVSSATSRDSELQMNRRMENNGESLCTNRFGSFGHGSGEREIY